ncbi:hypothetical protein GYH30_029981 [Glycine max]|nr:hypothetical protein GYH30_029981 [Glycine max]
MAEDRERVAKPTTRDSTGCWSKFRRSRSTASQIVVVLG